MKNFTKITTGILALVFVFGTHQTARAQNVVTTAQGAEDLSTLVGFVVDAGLVDTLANTPNLTVFAPTNKAFEKFPRVLLRAIENDPDILTDILTYHVVTEELSSSDVVAERSIETFQGSDIRVRAVGNKVFLNNAKVVTPDIDAGNGTVHIIDNVLIPWRDIVRDVMSALRHN